VKAKFGFAMLSCQGGPSVSTGAMVGSAASGNVPWVTSNHFPAESSRMVSPMAATPAG